MNLKAALAFMLLVPLIAHAKRYSVTSLFMGWMARQAFRCAADYNATALDCVNERLLVDHANLLVAGGYAELGYNRVHVDDCAVARARDPVTHVFPWIQPGFHRAPSGLAGLPHKSMLLGSVWGCTLQRAIPLARTTLAHAGSRM